MMHEVWREIVIRQNMVERALRLHQEVFMKRTIVFPVKQGMAALICVLNDVGVKVAAISEHITQHQTAT